MAPFDLHSVAFDSDIWGYDPKEDLQALFDRHHSVLAAHEFPGHQTAAQIIDAACHQWDVKKSWIAIRLEVEQSLVTAHALPSARALDYALGFGAGDGGDVLRFKGFGAQISWGCQWWRTHRAQYEPAMGHAFHTSDGYTIHPANLATLMCYAYTPHVGNKDKVVGGVEYKAPYGNFLLWQTKRALFPTEGI